MLEFLLQIDREVFLFLNGLHTPWLDPIMFWVSDKFFWIPFYMVLLWLFVKYYGWKTILIMVCTALLITLSDQITAFMKDYFQRPRPSREPTLEGLVHLVNNVRASRYGFVSSHAGNSWALAVFMIYLLKSKVKFIVPVMILYAFLNTYSRIYLGVHYPADVLVGGLIGVVCAIFVIWVFTLGEKKFYTKEQFS